MNGPTATPTPLASCPDDGVWLDLLDPRHREAANESALLTHLDACAHCQTAAEDVRKYQTLLLRGKAPGLTAEQRQSLDARVGLLAGQWQKPQRVSPGLTWALALTAATALVFVVTRPYVERLNQQQVAWERAVVDATAPSLDKPGAGVVTSLVEGDVQIASQDGHWRKLSGGDTVKFGHRLRNAGLKSQSARQARVVVPGRFELRLAPESEVEVLAMAEKDAFLRVRHGELESQVDKLKPGQRFGVLFAGFRATVLGTRFTVRHDETDSGVGVQVTEGTVRVDEAEDPYAQPGETMTTVHAGHRWQFAAGRMALEPIPALAPALAIPVQPAVPPQSAPGAAPTEAAAAPAIAQQPQGPPTQVRGVTAPGTMTGRAESPIHAPLARPSAKGFVVSPTTALQPHAIVIEVPPQQMPPPEQLQEHQLRDKQSTGRAAAPAREAPAVDRL